MGAGLNIPLQLAFINYLQSIPNLRPLPVPENASECLSTLLGQTNANFRRERSDGAAIAIAGGAISKLP